MKPKAVRFIVIHCSDSPQGRGDNAETIHRWHVDGNGWSGIGYHFVILEDGTVQNGRPTYWNGAHSKGYNASSIGICMIGCGDYTNEQMDALQSLIYDQLEDFPAAAVIGHNDLDKKKECPMFDVKAWWMNLGNI